jgi:hypothetical protein
VHRGPRAGRLVWHPHVVADASEKILEQLERLTGLYAEVAAPRSY